MLRSFCPSCWIAGILMLPVELIVRGVRWLVRR